MRQPGAGNPSPGRWALRVSWAVRLLYLAIAWLPVVYLGMAGDGSIGGRETLNVSRLTERTWETLLVAGGTAGVTLVLGLLVVPALSRLRLWGRRIWLLCAFVPLFIPPYVSAIGAVRMLGAQGWVTRMVVPGAEELPLGPTFPAAAQVTTPQTGRARLTNPTSATTQAELTSGSVAVGVARTAPAPASPPPPRGAPIYSRAGVIGVLAFSYLPLVLFGGWALLGLTDPAVEEWARLHASPGRVLRRVVLPRAVPGLAAGAAAVFLLAMAEFGIPEALRSYPVLSVEVYTQMGVYYSPQAGALAGTALVGLAVAGLAILAAVLRLIRPEWLEDLRSLRLPGTEEVAGLPVGSGSRLLWTGLFLLALVLPLVLLVGTLVASSLETEGWQAWATAWVTGRDELVTSVWLGLLGALLCLVLGWGMSGETERKHPAYGKRSAVGRVARTVAMVALFFPLVLPGPVAATGWSRLLSDLAGWGSGSGAGGITRTAGWIAQALLDGPGALLLAWAGRWTPVAFGLISLGRRQIPQEWHEAARLEGAPWAWRFRFVQWPVLKRPLVAAGALVFCLTLGEVGASVLLLPPGVTSLGVRLMTLMHYAPTAIVAAQSLMTAILGLAAAAVAYGVWKTGRRVRGS